jgi:hypothetical protein
MYYFYIQTGSLMSCILAHAAGNALNEWSYRTVFKSRIAEHDRTLQVLEAELERLKQYQRHIRHE